MDDFALNSLTDIVHAWQSQSHDAGLLLTNMFPDDRKIADWLSRGAVEVVSGFADCRLLVVHEDGFDRIFYAAKSFDAVARTCSAYTDNNAVDCVMDVVGPQAVQADATVKLKESGFEVRKSLTRMLRRVSSSEVAVRPNSRPAAERDALQISDALHRFFDVRAEQLPCVDEVRDLCVNGASFVVEEGDAIHAFLLGEVHGKKGMVRYWFTMPAGRCKGVGGSVMHAFFDHCKAMDSTFQELWVLDDNENAIKRYQHYGFNFDRLKDTVFEKKMK